MRYSAFYGAIQKYGWEKFEIKILEEFDDDATPECMSQREKYWIAHLRTMTPNGYNLTKGGEGCCGYKHSDKARAVISKNRRDWWAELTEEAREKFCEKLRNSVRMLSVESPKKLSEAGEKGGAAGKGRVVSQETREKLRAANTGKKLSPKAYQKCVARIDGRARP